MNIVVQLLSILLLTSCSLGPKYQTPCVEVPEKWKNSEKTVPKPEVCYWWEIFGDETLNELEPFAIQNNPNLYVALERVLEARAAAHTR